jgi:cytochrome P450
LINAFDLYRPEFWAEPHLAYALLARLRAEDPIHFCKHSCYPDLWHVTRYADLLHIERAAHDFLSSPRMTINTLEREQAVRALTGGAPYMVRPLNAMDSPEHQPMRAVLKECFSPSNLVLLESAIEAIASEYVNKMLALSGPFDFAKEIAAEYPLRVVMPLLGIPPSDYALMLRLTKQLFAPADPDSRRENVDLQSDPAADMREIYKEFADYFDEALKSRRRKPCGDLISKIANAKINGQFMGQADAISYCILIATAGHDTTAYSLCEAMLHMARNPLLYRRLVDDSQLLAPIIVEESLRLAAPTRHFIRTAKSDQFVGSVKIEAGQSVILWYPSACRDETVFPNPDVFDLERSSRVPAPAFGYGPHQCLGQYLARTELVVFLRTLSRSVPWFVLASKPRYSESNFVGGIKNLWISFA